MKFWLKPPLIGNFPTFFSLNFELTDIRESSQRHGQELISGGANPFVKNEVLISPLSQLHFQNSGKLLFYHSFLGTISIYIYTYICIYTFMFGYMYDMYNNYIQMKHIKMACDIYILQHTHAWYIHICIRTYMHMHDVYQIYTRVLAVGQTSTRPGFSDFLSVKIRWWAGGSLWKVWASCDQELFVGKRSMLAILVRWNQQE